MVFRLSALCLFVSPVLVAMPMPDFVDPGPLLEVVAQRAEAARPGAKLYTVDSIAPAEGAACTIAGWHYDFYAKVGPDVDKSEVEKIRITLLPIRSEKYGCAWQVRKEISHGEPIPWGLRPLDESLRAPVVSLKQLPALTAKHYGKEWNLDVQSVHIFRPDIEKGPSVAYLLNGKICGGSAYLVLNAENGSVFDAPQKPSCPL